MNTRISRRSMLKWMAVGTAGAVLSACGGPPAPAAEVPTNTPKPAEVPTNTPKPAEVPTPPPPKSIEIGWARHGAETDLSTENALAGFFADKHPGVTVKPLVLPWNDYNTQIPVMIAGGTAPDTFGCHPALLMQTYASKGLIVVEDYIKAAESEVQYDDILYHGDASFEGHIVGLPQKSCTHQLRFNKDLFAKAGLPTPAELFWKDKEKAWNWNTFIEMGQKLTKDLDGDGTPDEYFFGGWDGTNNIALIRAAGGDIFDEAITKCTLTEPKAIEALQFMADLVLKYKVQPPPEMRANELGINFPTGKIAVDSCTTCDQVRDLRKGEELPFAWDFVLLPAGTAGFRSWGDTDQIVISSKSPNPQPAFDWMVFRSSKEAWEAAYSGGVILAFSDGPTRWSIFESKAYTEPLAAVDVKMIQEGYKATIPSPFVPRCPDPYNVIFTIIPTELDNMLRGTKTPAQAAADMCALIEEVLAGG